MYVTIYCQTNGKSQGVDQQIINLKRIAESKGWYVKRTFVEETCEISNVESYIELSSLIDYIEKTHVDVVMISEISSIGNQVDDIIENIEMLHEKGIALYIQQFNLLTFENGKENTITRLILQALTSGVEMENSRRLTKQREGIKLAKLKGFYAGRKQGAITSPTALLKKYKNIADLIDNNELSIRAIARITNHSINTVRKIKQLKNV